MFSRGQQHRSEADTFLAAFEQSGADDLYEVTVHPERLHELERSGDYERWELIAHGGRVGIYSIAVNRRLGETELPLQIKPELFTVPVEAQRVGGFLLSGWLASGKTVFNDRKVRLATDITKTALNEGTALVVQPTDYFSSLLTNDATLRQIRSRSAGCVFDGISMIADTDDRVITLEASRAANHVGCSSLALTSDDRLVIVAQSSLAAQYASQLMPAASGSADWDDVAGHRSLQSFLGAAMERELAEECGIDPALIQDTRLIGHLRQLDRGGKPEFYGVSFLGCRFDDLDASADIFTADIEGIDLAGAPLESLRDILDAFRDQRESSFSFSLYANLAFLEHYLADAPALVAGWRAMARA